MTSAASDDPSPALRPFTERRADLRTEGEILEGRDDRLSRGRGLLFLFSLVASIYGLFQPSIALGVAVGVGWLG
ncbi:MAG: hypothetical protein AAGA56_22685, partial [Myxococcota bacterium]